MAHSSIVATATTLPLFDHRHLTRHPTVEDTSDADFCDRLDIPPLYCKYLAVQWRSGFLTGEPGCGKTTLACRRLKGAVVYNALEAAKKHNWHLPKALFQSVPNLISKLRAVYSEDRGRLSEIRTWLTEQKWLVLDDLGAGKTTAFAIEELYSLIDYRVTHELATLITSNLSIEELGSYTDPRLASRIYSLGPIKIMTGDYRKAAAVIDTAAD